MTAKVVEISIWSDPVWPTSPELEPLNLPTKLNDGREISTYRIEMRLVAVEIIDDEERSEWVQQQEGD